MEEVPLQAFWSHFRKLGGTLGSGTFGTAYAYEYTREAGGPVLKVVVKVLNKGVPKTALDHEARSLPKPTIYFLHRNWL